MKINIKTSLTIESNNKNFLKTKEFPKKGYDSLCSCSGTYNKENYMEVRWIELWEGKDGEVVELEFSRRYDDYTRWKGWNLSRSFAFSLLSGFLCSVDKRKNWQMTQMTKDQPCTCCMSISKVKSVVLNVNFEDKYLTAHNQKLPL